MKLDNSIPHHPKIITGKGDVYGQQQSRVSDMKALLAEDARKAHYHKNRMGAPPGGYKGSQMGQ